MTEFCPNCGAQFLTAPGLLEHQRSDHPREWRDAHFAPGGAGRLGATLGRGRGTLRSAVGAP